MTTEKRAHGSHSSLSGSSRSRRHPSSGAANTSSSGYLDDALGIEEPLSAASTDKLDLKAARERGEASLATVAAVVDDVSELSGRTAASSRSTAQQSSVRAATGEVTSTPRSHRSNKRPQDPFLKLFSSVGKSKKSRTVNGEERTPREASQAHEPKQHAVSTAAFTTTQEGKPRKRSESGDRGDVKEPRRGHDSVTPTSVAAVPVDGARLQDSSPLPLSLPTPLVAADSASSSSPLAVSRTHESSTRSTPHASYPSNKSDTPITTSLRKSGSFASVGPHGATASSLRGTTSMPTLAGLLEPSRNDRDLAHGKEDSLSMLSSTVTRTGTSRHSRSRGGGHLPQHTSQILLADWVRAPAECDYHTDLQRRAEAGQLLNTPYEQLLTRCLAAVLEQQLPFDDHLTFGGDGDAAEALLRSISATGSSDRTQQESTHSGAAAASLASLVKVKELYAAWREHWHAGDDIALASNRNNLDPYLGVIQHRLGIEWRLKKLEEITRHIAEAFKEEQTNYRLLVLAGKNGDKVGPGTPLKDTRAPSEGSTAHRSSHHPQNSRHHHRLSHRSTSVTEVNDADVSKSNQTGSEGVLSLPGSPLVLPSARGPRVAETLNPSGGGTDAEVNLRPASSPSPAPPAPQSIRVMAARSTVLYWHRKINLCQLFEELFLDTVGMAADLPLFLPKSFVAYYAAKRRGKRLGGVTNDSDLSTQGLHSNTSLYHEYVRQKARAQFLRESPKAVWQAECAHAEDVLAALLACWQRHEALREEMREFEKIHRRVHASCRGALAGSSGSRISCQREEHKQSGGGGSAHAESQNGAWRITGKPQVFQPFLAVGPAMPPPSLMFAAAPRAPSISTTPRGGSESPTMYTVLETCELAGVTDVNLVLMNTLHSSENAAAAVAALDSLSQDARKALSWYGKLPPGSSEEDEVDGVADVTRGALLGEYGEADGDEEEEELYSVQNLSPIETEEPEETRPARVREELSGSVAFTNSNETNSHGSAGSFVFNGSMRRIKLVVSSHQLADDSHPTTGGAHGGLADRGSGVSGIHGAPSLSSSSESANHTGSRLLARNAGSGEAPRVRHDAGSHRFQPEKHVTFVLEPTVFDDQNSHSNNFHQRTNSNSITMNATKAPSQSYNRLSRIGRQSAFSWKRYNDEKDEVSNVFAKRHRSTSASPLGSANASASATKATTMHRDPNGSTSCTNSMGSSLSIGRDDGDLSAIQERLRMQRQKVLQLFFKLDEEDGAQRLEEGLLALRRADASLRKQMAAINTRIHEIKTSSKAAASSSAAKSHGGDFLRATTGGIEEEEGLEEPDAKAALALFAAKERKRREALRGSLTDTPSMPSVSATPAPSLLSPFPEAPPIRRDSDDGSTADTHSSHRHRRSGGSTRSKASSSASLNTSITISHASSKKSTQGGRRGTNNSCPVM